MSDNTANMLGFLFLMFIAHKVGDFIAECIRQEKQRRVKEEESE